jgi:hypothetical protein
MAQFSRNAFARSSQRGESGSAGLTAGIAAFAFLAEPGSELLKSVVKSACSLSGSSRALHH